MTKTNEIIFPSIKDFNSQLNRLYFLSDKKEILTLTFQVTEDCNLNCSYCYQCNKTKNKMDFDIAKQTIDLILSNDDKIKPYIDVNKKNGIIIEFIGGEPFLEIELIEKISNYFIYQLIEKKHPWLLKYRFSITSNGILYFDKKVQNYIKKHKNHLSLNITIDGNQQLHDMCRRDFNNNPTYDKVLKAIKHYQENYVSELSTKLTISPENLDYLYDGITNLIELGFKQINFNPVFENVWKNEDATKYYYQLKKIINYLIDNNLETKIGLSQLNSFQVGEKEISNNNWCGGTGHMLAIDYQGEFYPCLRYMGSSLGKDQKPYIIGDLSSGINDIEKINLLKSITRSSQSTEKCLNCPISSGCSWCSAYNYQVYGTPNKRATFICKLHQARVLALKYFSKRLSEKHYIDNYQLNIPIDWALEIIPKEELNYLIGK